MTAILLMILSIAGGSADSAIYAWTLHTRAGVPYEYGLATWRAAQAQSVDPIELGAFLLSEKSGPVSDFSAGTSHVYDWDPGAEGSAGERGLFQLAPTWAAKAGYQRDDLWDPEINATVAAYVLRSAHESHAGCRAAAEARAKATGYPVMLLHTHIAHWKCGRASRDDRTGACFYAQKKLKKIQASLESAHPLDLQKVGREHNEWYDEQVSAMRDHLRHKENTRRRAALRKAKARIRDFEEELRNLRLTIESAQ